jgi:hypothetical protein
MMNANIPTNLDIGVDWRRVVERAKDQELPQRYVAR